MEERRITAMETGSMQERAAAARSHWSQVKRQVRAGVITSAEAAPHRPHISAAISLGWFRAEAVTELSLTPGEQLWVLEDPDRIATPSGWIMAVNAKGDEGLVPETYVRVIPSTDPGHARLHLKAQPAAQPRGRLGGPPREWQGAVSSTPSLSGTGCPTNRTRRSCSSLADDSGRGQEAMCWVSTPREERDASIADMVPPTPSPRESMTSPTSHLAAYLATSPTGYPPLEELLKHALTSELQPPPAVPPPGTPAPAHAVSTEMLPPVLPPLVLPPIKVVASPRLALPRLVSAPGTQPKTSMRERWSLSLSRLAASGGKAAMAIRAASSSGMPDSPRLASVPSSSGTVQTQYTV
jgi:hypothetical protein